MRINCARPVVPFDGFIGSADKHEEDSHPGETVSAIGIKIDRALVVVLGKVKVLAIETNPSEDQVALIIGLIKADAILGQFKSTIQRRIEPVISRTHSCESR